MGTSGLRKGLSLPFMYPEMKSPSFSLTMQTPGSYRKGAYMSSLPSRPSLENLKKQAKSLLHSHQQRDQAVCAVLRHLQRFATASTDEILSAELSLNEVQFALAQDYGFTSWRAMKQHVEQADPGRYLHIFCIQLPALALRESGVPGTVMTWQDPLIEGATPAGVTEQQWLELRAQQLTEIFPTSAQAMQALQNMDRQLAEYTRYQEVVLWFDACLYDQIILCRQLDWFAQQELGDTALSLICIGSYPGVPLFHGLGQLTHEQLAGLLPQRQTVTPAQTVLGVAAWQAYRSADPIAIERLLAQDTSALPYLAPALLKHLKRFPSVQNGLNRLEQEMLELVASGECRRFEQIFMRLSELEHPAYFGSEYLADQLTALTSGQHPLLSRDEVDASYSLTAEGEAVMRCQADWIARNGIDRWLGGVHLHGIQAQWRWDNQQRKLVRMG